MNIDFLGSEGVKEILLNSNSQLNFNFTNLYTETSTESQLSDEMDYTMFIYKEKISESYKKTIEDDLKKSFIKCITNTDSEVLVVDLLSHKYELGQVNQTIVTLSDTFKNNINDIKLNAIPLNVRLERLENIFIDLDKYLNKYNHITLIKIFLPEVYTDESNNICEFENLDSINRVNSFLKSVYHQFESSINKLNVVKIAYPIARTNNYNLSMFRYHEVTGIELTNKLKENLLFLVRN